MFGHEWEKAEGTIVDARIKHDYHEAEGTPVWEFIIDVRPAGQPGAQPMMRAQVHQPHGDEGFWPPGTGDTVTVEVSRDGKVRFDRHDPRISYHERLKRVNQQSDDEFSARLHQPPGT
jgi:hypothetical protein